jgi:hypothetical protein
MLKHKIGISSILILVTFVFFSLLTGCSKEPENKNKKTPPENITRQENKVTPQEEIDEEDANPVKDKGSPCRMHEYQIMPGNTVNLRFDIELIPSDKIDYTDLDLNFEIVKSDMPDTVNIDLYDVDLEEDEGISIVHVDLTFDLPADLGVNIVGWKVAFKANDAEVSEDLKPKFSIIIQRFGDDKPVSVLGPYEMIDCHSE